MTRARDLAAFVSNADGDIKFDTDTLFIDSSANRVGIGETEPDRSLHIKAQVPSIRLEDTDVSGLYNEIVQLSGGDLSIRSDHGGVQSDSSMSFSVDGSERMHIDSSGNIGIGRDPRTRLEIASGNTSGDAGLDAPVFRITNTTSSGDWDSGDVNGTIEFYTDDTSGNAPYDTAFIQSIGDSNNGTLPSGALVFGTAAYNASGGAVERMRIDSSGNVGIGVTDTEDAKLVIRSTGVDGTYAPVISFQYSSNSNEHNSIGSTVSSNATNSGINFKISDGGGATTQTEVARITRNGIAFFGDNAEANSLDDYEEGTWTPDLKLVSASSTSSTYSSRSGSYTKIGNQCTVRCVIFNTGHTGSGTAYIHGLPFVHAGSSESIGSVQVNTHSDSWSTDIGTIASIIQSGESVIHMRATYNTNANGPLYIPLQNFTYLRITITYRTA